VEFARLLSARPGRSTEEADAGIGCHPHDASGHDVGEGREISEARRLRAVDRVLDDRTVAATLDIDKIGYVACGYTQSERVTLDCCTSEKLYVVQTDATVVNSLIVTLGGALLPTTAMSAIAGLSVPDLSAAARDC
jgi:hypothetical protein